ncbi:MAG: pyruvate formate lyase family protein [Thermodesulfobacteriota bacterium]|nr:pyruvate formate lyase family protein [Thermodesulfobacteriota bacterium]
MSGFATQRTEELKNDIIPKGHVVKKIEGRPAQHTYRPGVRLCVERARFLTESYKQTEGEPEVLRRAKALAHILENMTICIRDNELIAGYWASIPEGLVFYPELSAREIEEGLDNVFRDITTEEEVEEIKEICAYWEGISIEDRVLKVMPEDLKDYVRFSTRFNTICTSNNFSAGLGVPVPDNEKLLQLGLNGIIEQIDNRLAELKKSMKDIDTKEYIEQLIDLEAMKISCQGVIRFAERFSQKAGEMAEAVADPQRKKDLEKIAEICAHVPANPPRTLHEAMQAYVLSYIVAYLIEYRSQGCGARWDVLFRPYYEKDLEEGRIDRRGAQELCEALLIKMEEMGRVLPREQHGIFSGGSMLQNVMIGGVTKDGEDACNELTHIVLDAAMAVKNPLTNLVFRYHDKANPDTISKVIDCIRVGLGYPAIFNDACALDMMEGYDIPLEEARNYTIPACVGWAVTGKFVGVYTPDPGVLSLGKCFDLALSEGWDVFTQKQLGCRTPDPMSFTNTEDIMQAYLQQVRFIAEKMAAIDDMGQDIMSQYVQRPYFSVLFDGNIEKGNATKCERKKWSVNPMIIITGTVDIADSLAAIKKFVFDDKVLTWEEMLDALKNNFEGREDLRQRLLKEAPKFGNDDDYVDLLLKEVQHRTQKEVAKIVGYWDIPYTIDGSIAGAYYPWGRKIGAFPNGRMAKETLADGSLSPYPDWSTSGPTAVIKSMSKVKPVFAELANQRFMPQFLEGENKEQFAAYLKTWSDMGNYHIQFNVVNDEELHDAQEHPENHANLTVRVAGYSAYFVDLSKGVQDEIIKRVSQSF